MHSTFRQGLVRTIGSVILVFSASIVTMQIAAGQIATRAQTSEQKTARYFESIRKSPTQQLAFLLEMPKGGDLHNHLSGSIYAESYIEWAAANGLCVNNQTMTLLVPPAKFRALPPNGRCLVHEKLAAFRTEWSRSFLRRVW